MTYQDVLQAEVDKKLSNWPGIEAATSMLYILSLCAMIEWRE